MDPVFNKSKHILKWELDTAISKGVNLDWSKTFSNALYFNSALVTLILFLFAATWRAVFPIESFEFTNDWNQPAFWCIRLCFNTLRTIIVEWRFIKLGNDISPFKIFSTRLCTMDLIGIIFVLSLGAQLMLVAEVNFSNWKDTLRLLRDCVSFSHSLTHDKTLDVSTSCAATIQLWLTTACLSSWMIEGKTGALCLACDLEFFFWNVLDLYLFFFLGTFIIVNFGRS